MKKRLVVLATVIGLAWSYLASAEITISLTDGTETRDISLNAAQTAKLETAMTYMGAKKYSLENKIDPIVENGNTVLQQTKQVIIEILQGIYLEVERESINLDATVKKQALDFSSVVVKKDTKFAVVE
jgi:hypothetical protein